jgi:AcrR family transcriptional regulator
MMRAWMTSWPSLVYYSRYTRILAEIIEQGVENGELAEVNPRQAALAIIGMYEGITLMWFIDPKSIDWDELADLPLEMILGGIRRRDL